MPSLALTNRDVILRHIFAIAFGAAMPGVAGRMIDYVQANGTIEEAKLKELVDSVGTQTDFAVTMSHDAFGGDVLNAAGLSDERLRIELDGLKQRIRDVIERTSRQVIELRQAIERYSRTVRDPGQAVRAGDLVARLLGIPSGRQRDGEQADDRSSGYPLRRFAESGLLPGYAFPVEPATLRLMGEPYGRRPLLGGAIEGVRHSLKSCPWPAGPATATYCGCPAPTRGHPSCQDAPARAPSGTRSSPCRHVCDA